MELIAQAVQQANAEYFSGPKWEPGWRRWGEYQLAQRRKSEAALESLLGLCDRLKLLDEVNCNDADVIDAAKKVLAESKGIPTAA